VVRLGRTADATINGRHLAAAASAVAAVLLLLAPGARAVGPSAPAFVPQELLDAAAANPDQIYRVIVQGTTSQPVTTVEAGVEQTMTTAPATGDSVNDAFSSIGAVSAELTGEQIELLAADPGIFAITPDMPLRASVTDPPVAVEPPTVTGTAQTGATLSASPGQWSPEQLDYAYQWQRCDASSVCTDITGSTGTQYALTASDDGYTVRVVVTASDGSASAAAASEQTAAVAPAPAPAPLPSGDTSTTTATGTSGSGSTNSGSGSTNSGSSGGTSTSSTSTSTSTSSTSTSSTSTSTSTTSTSTSTTSTSTLTSPDVPTNVTPPIVVGNPVVGTTLWASHGTWSNVDDHPDYDWRWQRCNVVTALCAPINNWSRWYTPGNADVGSTLQVVVTVSDNGNRASATSSQTDRVAPYSPSGFFNWQLGPYAAKVDSQWTALATAAANPPAIAVVDSGVDSTLPGLDGSVVDQEVLTSLPQSTAADGYGHGSFVAQVAAGHARGDAGASPTARIVSLDVMNDDGMALTSDVVAAADWIYTHKAENNIKVANFSLIGGSPSSIMFDPLDRALERLWFSGVVVVTAAGNFAVDGQQSDEPFAPANDPFVITVGASDTAGTVATTDDTAAPWSAYGHTLDGFAKPELSAPGRYVVESVPTDSTLYQERPDRVVAPGQIELSGTSFAAPMVSGIAANLLALHPNWTPDQVKGALMLTAAQPTSATGFALGVGVVNADAAAGVTDPPNPNAALDQFLVPDPNDAATKVFDTASWGTTAQADASWGTASWGTASWGTASWGTASWGTTYWSSASWGTASWGTASWGTASWGTASWGTDNALSDLLPGGFYPMSFP
jgi:serine protease AprX